MEKNHRITVDAHFHSVNIRKNQLLVNLPEEGKCVGYIIKFAKSEEKDSDTTISNQMYWQLIVESNFTRTDSSTILFSNRLNKFRSSALGEFIGQETSNFAIFRNQIHSHLIQTDFH